MNTNIDKNSNKYRKLLRVNSVVLEMMKDRGYNLANVAQMTVEGNVRQFKNVDLTWMLGSSNERKIAFAEENGLFRSRQEFSAIYTNEEGTKLAIVLYLLNQPGKQVSKNEFGIVNEFIATGQMKNYDFILISKTGLNADSSSNVRSRISGYNIMEFKDREFAINPTKSALAPIGINHITGEEQIKAWKEEEELEPSKLPMIQDVDPISKWFGAKPGDIIQTEILGTQASTQFYARLVRKAASANKK